MRTNKIVLAITGVAALCLVCAVLLSAGEVGAEPTETRSGASRREVDHTHRRRSLSWGDAAASSATTSPSGASSNRGASRALSSEAPPAM